MKRLDSLLLLPVLGCLSLMVYFPILSQSSPQIGYAVLDVPEGVPVPSGAVLFSSNNAEGILIWEAGVSAVEPTSRGRIFVDQSGDGRTALALVVASGQREEVVFIVRDRLGIQVDRQEGLFEPRGHRALFVDELFPDLPQDFLGSLTFETVSGNAALAAVTLRQNTNPHGEPIFATLPVVDLEEANRESPLVFPQVGVGGGLSTQLILINPALEPVRGLVRLTASDGTPLQADLEGVSSSEFPIEIEADGVFRAELTSRNEARSGYAEVTIEEGRQIPLGTTVFQFRKEGMVVTEAGVSVAESTTRARIFVDNHRTRTRVALASPGNPSQELRFRLLDRFGQDLARTERRIESVGHAAFFADELFPHMPKGFSGQLEVTAEFPVRPVALKLSFNGREDPILTSLPVADATPIAEGRPMIFPHLAFGEGLATRLILINADASMGTNGLLRFFHTGTGKKLVLPLGDRQDSEFEVEIGAGSGVDRRPGSTAAVAGIRLDSFNPEFSEVTVNQGSLFRLRPRVIDVEGNPRDDFQLSYRSLDEQVATIDEGGLIEGLRKGFSTLTLQAGGVEFKGLIAVVEVIGGSAIGETTGIAADLAGRVYLSSEKSHVIWRADSIGAQPTVFAGVPGRAGLRNGSRDKALFKTPSHMALHHASGDLYVADSGNHVIRVVRGNGEVVTLAGTGRPGSRDGIAQASFRNPQGIALDNRGHLWVVDSGNHTIRRIDLVTREVETVAGLPGRSGNRDGKGAQARFHSPIGIALESRFVDSFEGSGAAGLVVADSVNRTIRRVFQDGWVVTLAHDNVDPGKAAAERRVMRTPLLFRSPGPPSREYQVRC